MNKNENLTTVTARNLRPGMVLAGSGFVVTATSYRGLRTPKGKCVVVGNYPGKRVRGHEWNASTTLLVVPS